MENNPSSFKGGNLPVETASWNDAIEFCQEVVSEDRARVSFADRGEWEYACRAGTTTPFAFGETITPEIVNYNGDYPYGNAAKGTYREKTMPVG